MGMLDGLKHNLKIKSSRNKGFRLAVRRSKKAVSSSLRKLYPSKREPRQQAALHADSRWSAVLQDVKNAARFKKKKQKKQRLYLDDEDDDEDICIVFVPDETTTTSSSDTLSDNSSVERQERRCVEFSEDDEIIAAEPHHFVDRSLWWNRHDRERASNKVAAECCKLAASSDYRTAAVAVQAHCCEAARPGDRTPTKVLELVDVMCDLGGRGLERILLRKLSAPDPLLEELAGVQDSVGSRSVTNSVESVATVLQLQVGLNSLGCCEYSGERQRLLATHYRRYGEYAATWAWLMGEGDSRLLFAAAAYERIEV